MALRSSAQVAIEDSTFRELFGMIWVNTDIPVTSTKDYAWATLYKDVLLQALADFANAAHMRLPKRDKELAIDSLNDWLYKKSPFNDLGWVEEARLLLVTKTMETREETTPKQRADAQYASACLASRLGCPDPFDFESCCEMTGLDPDEARGKFIFYRSLKERMGAEIRIVTPTVGQGKPTERSQKDIIDSSKAGGSIQTAEYLRSGTCRLRRDTALRKLNILVDDKSKEVNDRSSGNTIENKTGSEAG